MRVESMVAQQAVVAGASPRPLAPHGGRRQAEATAPTGRAALPAAVADRLATLFASDPGLEAAVWAQLPEARLRSAQDMATYTPTGHYAQGRRLDTTG